MTTFPITVFLYEVFYVATFLQKKKKSIFPNLCTNLNPERRGLSQESVGNLKRCIIFVVTRNETTKP